MFQSVAIAPGITATVNLSYVTSTANSAKVSVQADIGLVVAGSANGGQDIKFVGDGAFVFDQVFKIPVINDANKHYYQVIRRTVDGIDPAGQLYALYLDIFLGDVELSTTIEETIHAITTQVPEPLNFRASTLNGAGASMAMLEWSNSTPGMVEIFHYIEPDSGFDINNFVLLNSYRAPLGSSSFMVEIGNQKKYHMFVARRVTDVPSIRSSFTSTMYRVPMLPVVNVASRIMRNGILVSWIDPNTENAGKVLKYRIRITGTGGYSSTIVTESDQRSYYFANLPQGREYTFSVAVIDPVTNIQSSYSADSAPLFLVFSRFGETQPFDYRLGTSLVSHLFVGDQVIWTRS